jgi:hypothetical protein
MAATTVIKMYATDLAVVDRYCEKNKTTRSAVLTAALKVYKGDEVAVTNAIAARIHTKTCGKDEVKLVGVRFQGDLIPYFRTLCNSTDLAFDPLMRTLIWDYMRRQPTI